MALSLAVLFYGIQSKRFTPNLSRSCLWSPRCWRSQPVFDLQMVIWRATDPVDHRGPILMGSMFLMRTHRLGLVFSPSPLSLFTGKPSPPCSTIRSGRALNPVVYRCRPLPDVIMTLIGVLWFPSRAITQMHQALMIGLMMPLAT